MSRYRNPRIKPALTATGSMTHVTRNGETTECGKPVVEIQEWTEKTWISCRAACKRHAL